MSNHKNNLVSHVKKQAKTLNKSEPDKCHNDCLNIVAHRFGYQNYHNLLQACKPSVVKSHPLELFSSEIKAILQRYVDDSKYYYDQSYKEPDFPESVYITQEGRNKLPGSHKFSKEEITDELFSLLSDPIDVNSDLHKIGWLTRWAVYKDGIKELGYGLLEAENHRELGYLLISLAHFYRSLMDNCSYKIGEHIDFKSYFGYWLNSIYANDKSNATITSLLNEFSAQSPSLMNGATSWAPEWWLKNSGRI